MMQRPEYEGFYGGAAGGGKSDYLLVEALRQVHIPNYKAIIFRKTYPELSELIDRSRWLYIRAYPKARYNSTEHCWHFPSGAKIYFGNLNRPADKIKYQGKQFDFIGFDELTHFTFDEYAYMYSRNRPSGPGTRVYRRATGNPGGIGHGWVKQYFVRAAEPGTPVTTHIDVRTPDGETIKMTRKKIFIPSRVFDNKALLENNPDYLASLALLPEQDRLALMDGNWDSFSGQVFMEWKDDPDGYNSRRFTHVINDFPIPTDWKIYRGFDFGYSKPFAVGWYAVDHDSRIYRIREWYGCTKVANTGIKLTPDEIAKGILERERADPNLKGRKIIGIADPAIFAENGGESIGASMERVGVCFDHADHERIAGKMQCHYRLAFDEFGIPMFYVFRSCKEFIRTIPSLVYDETKVEDIDTDQEDHIYDEWRYVMMEHPLNPRRNMDTMQIPQEDPLDLYKDSEEIGNKYYFYRV
jgi:hypothetical protein